MPKDWRHSFYPRVGQLTRIFEIRFMMNNPALTAAAAARTTCLPGATMSLAEEGSSSGTPYPDFQSVTLPPTRVPGPGVPVGGPKVPASPEMATKELRGLTVFCPPRSTCPPIPPSGGSRRERPFGRAPRGGCRPIGARGPGAPDQWRAAQGYLPEPRSVSHSRHLVPGRQVWRTAE